MTTGQSQPVDDLLDLVLGVASVIGSDGGHVHVGGAHLFFHDRLERRKRQGLRLKCRV